MARPAEPLATIAVIVAPTITPAHAKGYRPRKAKRITASTATVVAAAGWAGAPRGNIAAPPEGSRGGPRGQNRAASPNERGGPRQGNQNEERRPPIVRRSENLHRPYRGRCQHNSRSRPDAEIAPAKTLSPRQERHRLQRRRIA